MDILLVNSSLLTYEKKSYNMIHNGVKKKKASTPHTYLNKNYN